LTRNPLDVVPFPKPAHLPTAKHAPLRGPSVFFFSVFFFPSPGTYLSGHGVPRPWHVQARRTDGFEAASPGHPRATCGPPDPRPPARVKTTLFLPRPSCCGRGPRWAPWNRAIRLSLSERVREHRFRTTRSEFATSLENANQYSQLKARPPTEKRPGNWRRETRSTCFLGCTDIGPVSQRPRESAYWLADEAGPNWFGGPAPGCANPRTRRASGASFGASLRTKSDPFLCVARFKLRHVGTDRGSPTRTPPRSTRTYGAGRAWVDGTNTAEVRPGAGALNRSWARGHPVVRTATRKTCFHSTNTA